MGIGGIVLTHGHRANQLESEHLFTVVEFQPSYTLNQYNCTAINNIPQSTS